MDRYYYSVSQLSSLTFDRAPPITVERFLAETKKWLTRRDYRALEAVDIRRTKPEKGDHPLFRDHLEFERELRRNLAAWRRGRADGVEVKPLGLPVHLLKDGNPLQVEKRLLEHRWNRIAEGYTRHDFDLGFLILYHMQLQILDWLAEFDTGRGLARFMALSTAHSAVDLETVAPGRGTGSEGTGE